MAITNIPLNTAPGRYIYIRAYNILFKSSVGVNYGKIDDDVFIWGELL
tara:strand:+ start:1301 stop:1444 length:144 start_codon:yes stop_codon:yes gene_type:complete